jgi:hypothetical protein
MFIILYVYMQVKKYLKTVPHTKHEYVRRCIRKLHKSTSKERFEKKLAEVERQWIADEELKTFREYFFKVWINSNDSNWQIFCSPCGYCATNNPIESYNNKIKSQFTVRVLMCKYYFY